MIKEEESDKVPDLVDDVHDSMFGDELEEQLAEPKEVEIDDDMFGDNNGDADLGKFDQNIPQPKEQVTQASSVQNYDAIAEINLGSNNGIQLKDNCKPAIEEEDTVILDSGLGFVLDHSPDTPINTKIDAPSNQDTSHASALSDQKALILGNAEDQDDNETDMFGPDTENDGAKE